MRAHLLCGLALLASHSALQAKELTVDAEQQGHGFIYGYGISNDDDNAERDTGVGIDAGFQFTSNFALYGGYQHYATQSQQGSQDDGVHGALVGGTFNVFPHLDVFSQASWYSDVQFDFAAGADIFYPLSQGWQIRGRIGAKVEGGTFFTLGIRYNFAAPTTMTTGFRAPPTPPKPTPPTLKRVLREQFLLDVKFAHDKATITSEYLPQAKQLADILRQDEELSITIEGHTSLIGSEAYNLDLSQRRANAVRELLITRYGINPSRITAVGYGEQQPIAHDGTPEAQKVNRRVVALIYYYPKK